MGSVASTATKMSSSEIHSHLESTAFPAHIKEELLTSFETAADDTVKYKENYGHGVSVKLLISNVSQHHSLNWEDAYILSGKYLTDPLVVMPRVAAPLRSVAGFHAKCDGAMVGTFGCIQYTVRNNANAVKAYIAIAWSQPYSSGTFRCHLAVSRRKINVKAIAHICAAAEGLTREVGISGDSHLTSYVKARAEAVEGSTGELFVVVKGDHIAKMTEDFVCE